MYLRFWDCCLFARHTSLCMCWRARVSTRSFACLDDEPSSGRAQDNHFCPSVLLLDVRSHWRLSVLTEKKLDSCLPMWQTRSLCGGCRLKITLFPPLLHVAKMLSWSSRLRIAAFCCSAVGCSLEWWIGSVENVQYRVVRHTQHFSVVPPLRTGRNHPTSTARLGLGCLPVAKVIQKARQVASSDSDNAYARISVSRVVSLANHSPQHTYFRAKPSTGVLRA